MDIFGADQQQGLPGVDNPMREYVPLSDLAQLLDMSARNLQYLAKDGVIPQSVNGLYHYEKSIQGYIRKLREEAAGRAKSNERESLELRRLAAKVTLEELDAAKASGSVIDSMTVIKEWENLLMTYKTRSRLIPRNTGQEISDTAMSLFLAFLKNHLEEEAADALMHTAAEEISQAILHKAESIISAQVDEALNELSQYNPPVVEKT